MQTNQTNYGAVSTLTTVFFFWGFIAAGNSIFIPFCKHYFDLDQYQSQLIDFAFYGAYYLGAIGLFVFSNAKGQDIVRFWGYKKSIVYGLLFSMFGAAAMIVSVYQGVFAGMLVGLFIVALGFSLQQTAANPFMISLGDESTGSNRISLGGGVNSFGTFIGPIIVSIALFGSAAAVSDKMIQSLSLTKVIILYTCVGALFLGVALLFGFSKKVPKGRSEETEKAIGATKALATLAVITGLLIACFVPVFASYRSPEAKEIAALEQKKAGMPDAMTPELQEMNWKIKDLKQPLDHYRITWLSAGLVVIVGSLLYANRTGKKQGESWGAMQYPQVTLGMLAIFVYVGVEVAIGSNLGELLKHKKFGGYQASQITPFVSMYWGSLMIGRWMDAINVFKLKNAVRLLLQILVPIVAFGVLIGILNISHYDTEALTGYIICVAIQIVGYQLARNKPVRSLVIFGILGMTAMIVGLTTAGMTAVYAFLSGGLFCSIMWSCIFALSLAGTGRYQAQGSAFLVMMILGGAIIPPIQGKLSDIIGIQESFIVGAVCFAYITFFAVFANRLVGRKVGTAAAH